MGVEVDGQYLHLKEEGWVDAEKRLVSVHVEDEHENVLTTTDESMR